MKWRAEHEITVAGGCDACYPTFDAAPLPPKLRQLLGAAGFATPSAIQGQAWPPALESRDVIGVAKTGSGKTLGFMVPAFVRLCESGFPRPCQSCAPRVLVLAPTRELATQIEVEAQKFGGPLGVRSVCCYGGAPKGPQLSALRGGAHVCIATPGRLNDFLESGAPAREQPPKAAPRELAERVREPPDAQKKDAEMASGALREKPDRTLRSRAETSPRRISVPRWDSRLRRSVPAARRSGLVGMHAVDYLVFDEADRMLDMGFEPQIRKIVARRAVGAVVSSPPSRDDDAGFLCRRTRRLRRRFPRRQFPPPARALRRRRRGAGPAGARRTARRSSSRRRGPARSARWPPSSWPSPSSSTSATRRAR